MTSGAIKLLGKAIWSVFGGLLSIGFFGTLLIEAIIVYIMSDIFIFFLLFQFYKYDGEVTWPMARAILY